MQQLYNHATHLPWKHSRYSSLCPVGFTWMILTGKLLVEAANTAEAKVWSFLSRNSAKRMEKNSLITSNFFFLNCFRKSPTKRICGATWCIPQEMSPTFQRVLLHLNFIELVGSNDDAVSGQMDAAARLRGFNLLEKREVWTNISSL